MLLAPNMNDEIAENLRAAIAASGLSQSEIARKTGIPQATVSRFLDGAGLQTGNASRLAAFFGLKLVHDEADDEPPPQKPKKKS